MSKINDFYVVDFRNGLLGLHKKGFMRRAAIYKLIVSCYFTATKNDCLTDKKIIGILK